MWWRRYRPPRLRRWFNSDGTSDLIVPGRNAEMRALLGADQVPAKQLKAKSVDDILTQMEENESCVKD